MHAVMTNEWEMLARFDANVDYVNFIRTFQ